MVAPKDVLVARACLNYRQHLDFLASHGETERATKLGLLER